jgi:peptidase C25-like protein
MKKIVSMILVGIIVLINIGSGTPFAQNIFIDEYDMVIIAPEEFNEALQPLINHKHSVDVETLLKTTEEVYLEYPGHDKAEQIKYCIKDMIETYNIKYVLLVGGHKGQLFQWHVPVRIVHLADGARYTEFVSDLYFADIFREDGSFDDWNSNNDDIIAEWGKDTFDLIPDVSVGRLPCRNQEEVTTIVGKIIEYETGSFDYSWFNQFVVAGGDTVPNTGDPFPFEGEIVCEEACSIMDDFNPIKLLISDLSLVDYNDFIDALNQGSGFALYSGRAGPSAFLTFDEYGNAITPLHASNLNQLSNKVKYPVFIINGCLSGKFDVTILNFIKYILKQPNIENSDISWDCIAYNLVNLENAGAIASIAPTSQCWVGLGDKDNNQIPDMIEIASGFLSLEFLRVYANENIDILGEMHSKAIENYVNVFPVYGNKIDCKTVQEYGLIGDPSLKIGGYNTI